MNALEREQRDRVETAALSWIGTPYHNHARVKGANGGVDCANLLAMVYIEADVIEPFDIENYPPQFFLHSSEERFMARVLEHSHEVDEADAKCGDVVLYKIGLCYAHGAIIVSPGWPFAIIHAHAMSRCVLRSGGRDAELGRSLRHPRFFSRW